MVPKDSEDSEGVYITQNDDTSSPDPLEAKIVVKATGVSGLTREIDFGAGYANIILDGVPLATQIQTVTGDSNIDVSYEITRRAAGPNGWSFQDSVTATLKVKKDGLLISSDSVKFVAFRVVISEFNRVSPGKPKKVSVTITPSPMPDGHSISLSCDPDEGTTGSATVLPITISQSTTELTPVTITGGTQSWGSGVAAPGNIKLNAKVNDTIVASNPFTVCAHPDKVIMDFDAILSPGWYMGGKAWGASYDVSFECDSGDINDCDKVRVIESIKSVPGVGYFSTIFGLYNYEYMSIQEIKAGGDWHTMQGGADAADMISMCGAYGTMYLEQHWEFYCPRCGIKKSDEKVIEKSGFKIDYSLSQDASQKYWIHITKSGCDLPSLSVESGDSMDAGSQDAEIKE